MPVVFSSEDRVINPPPSPRNSPRISVTLRTPRTRQSGKESRSPKTHTSGRKRKTKVKNAKKSKRGSQKKRGRRASRRQRGGDDLCPDAPMYTTTKFLPEGESQYDEVQATPNGLLVTQGNIDKFVPIFLDVIHKDLITNGYELVREKPTKDSIVKKINDGSEQTIYDYLNEKLNKTKSGGQSSFYSLIRKHLGKNSSFRCGFLNNYYKKKS